MGVNFKQLYISKKQLKEVDYELNFRIFDFYGNSVLKEYTVTRPASTWQKFTTTLKNLFQ